MLAMDPYQLLGVQRTSTAAEVVLAYDRLSEVFDPRRWAGSPSLVHDAVEWSEAIDEARRMILGR